MTFLKRFFPKRELSPEDYSKIESYVSENHTLAFLLDRIMNYPMWKQLKCIEYYKQLMDLKEEVKNEKIK